jgi:hypothetical protein
VKNDIKNSLAAYIPHDLPLTVLFHPKLPTDIRHNAKINREKLAEWAAKKLKNKK